MPVVGVGRDKLFELLGGEYAKFSMSLFCYVLHESLLHQVLEIVQVLLQHH
jgi:hypothetical protein